MFRKNKHVFGYSLHPNQYKCNFSFQMLLKIFMFISRCNCLYSKDGYNVMQYYNMWNICNYIAFQDQHWAHMLNIIIGINRNSQEVHLVTY